jgi:hypothetical protein
LTTHLAVEKKAFHAPFGCGYWTFETFISDAAEDRVQGLKQALEACVDAAHQSRVADGPTSGGVHVALLQRRVLFVFF